MKIISFDKLKIAATCLLLIFTILIGCKKNELRMTDVKDPSDGGFFKLGWFSPAITTQGVQLKINGQRMSGLLGLGAGFSSTTQYAMPYPGGGLNTGGNNKNDYLSVPIGNIEVAVTIPKVGTSTDSIVVMAPKTIPIELGKFYTYIVTDSFPAATSYILSDDAMYADSGYVKLKITNAIPNAGPLDFLMTNTRVTDTLVASNIDYKGASAFITLPFTPGAVTFKMRKTGTTTIINASPYSTTSIANKRVFTLVARGYVGATGTRAPTYSYIFNK